MAMSVIESRKYQRLIDHFRTTIRDAARERPRHTGTVTTTMGPELEWVVIERQVMLDAFNSERDNRGLVPIPLSLVVGAESSACGHIDYATKFAIGCAGLVTRPNHRTSDRLVLDPERLITPATGCPSVEGT